MEVRKEVAFFDEFAAGHGDYDVLGEGAYRRLLSLFAELASPRPGDRCADLGCGTGAFTKRLQRYRLRLVGVDISPLSVAQAARSADGERYVVGDITRLGVADRALDIVVFSGVLHHCDRRDQRVSILREARRVLRPGGAFFAFDPSAHSPSMWLYRDPRSPLHSTKGKTDNEVLLRRDELAAELGEAGFGDVVIRGVAGITFRYVEGRLARLFLPVYNLYERALRWSPLEDRLGTFLVSSARRPAGAGDRTS
jgi:ubiquinone/menaquinone biosynthesis C-methylase UbiE